MSDITQATSAIEESGLIYLKEERVAGIHMRGLARLLGCDVSAIKYASVAVSECDILKREMPTAGGVQGVLFVLEPGVRSILKHIRRGNFAQETKDAAEDLYDRFAEAGFKLYVMLKVAPESIAEMLPQAAPVVPPIILDPMERNVSLALRLAGAPGEQAIKALEVICSAMQPTPIAPTPTITPTTGEPTQDDLCDAIVRYLEGREGRQSGWAPIARGVGVLRPAPGDKGSKRLNNKGNVTRLLTRIEKRGQGRWVEDDLFQLN